MALAIVVAATSGCTTVHPIALSDIDTGQVVVADRVDGPALFGRFEGADSAGVSISLRRTRETAYVPIDEITAMNRRVGSYAREGMLFGLAAGLAASRIPDQSCASDCIPGLGIAVAAILGAGGALAGGLVGLMFNRWAPVQVPTGQR